MPETCQQDHDFGEFYINCGLPFGHDGPLHYDFSLDLTWKEGRPAMTGDWILETETCSICRHDVDVNEIEDHYKAHRERGDEPTEFGQAADA